MPPGNDAAYWEHQYNEQIRCNNYIIETREEIKAELEMVKIELKMEQGVTATLTQRMATYREALKILLDNADATRK